MATTHHWDPDLTPSVAWMAKPGDKLGGTIVEVSTRVSTFQEAPYPILTIRAEIPGCTEEGGKPIPPGSERAFHAFRTVARNRLAELRPQVGEQIAIAHFGQETPGDTKSAFRYRITMRRAGGGAVDWDAMAAAGAVDEPDTDEIPPEPPGGIPY